MTKHTDTSRIADLRFQVSKKMPINHSDLSCLFDRIEALEGKVGRLREVLSRWQYSGCPHCSGDCGSANPPVTSCIMEETRAALGEKQ